MQDQFRTGSVTVDRMSRLHISGNIIPVTWYKTIRKSTGKPNLNAIIILRILYIGTVRQKCVMK